MLPVAVNRPCSKLICEMSINNWKPWRRFFLSQIRRNYADSPYLPEIYPELEGLVNAPSVMLETLNVETTKWVANLLGKKAVPVVYSSLVNRNSEAYLKLRKEAFSAPFKHPYYRQMVEPFEEGLSVLDALLCAGADNVREMLKHG